MKVPRLTRLLPLLPVILLLSSCGRQQAQIPTNVILVIGDGMGAAQITAGMTMAKGDMNIKRMTHGGLITTHSANKYVTDSAAGGSALASGEKTNNGMVGMRPDSSRLTTVLDVAETAGCATGLVAACKITHATPATFDAHVPHRRMSNEIAEQMAQSKAEVLFGGGIEDFIPQSQEGSRRKDDKDLLAELKATHEVVLSPEAFQALGTPERAVALLEMGHIKKAPERAVSLKAMVEKAIEILKQNSNGFFLMVEGSQIDWEGHDNCIGGIETEVVDLDRTLGAILDFAEKDGETLVILTADHETGGLTLLDGSISEGTISNAHFSTGSHSGTMVPLLAFGPGADAFSGVHDNTDIGKMLKSIFTR